MSLKPVPLCLQWVTTILKEVRSPHSAVLNPPPDIPRRWLVTARHREGHERRRPSAFERRRRGRSPWWQCQDVPFQAGGLFCRLPNPPGHAIVSSIYPYQINTIGLCLVLCGPAFAERQGTETRGGINMPKSLSVEDNELNCDMLSRRLERKGCAVVCAGNGQESIPKARPGRPGLSLKQNCGGKHLKPAP